MSYKISRLEDITGGGGIMAIVLDMKVVGSVVMCHSVGWSVCVKT